MINCRYFVAPGLSRGLHVHDDPGYVVDALRCQDNGWTVWVDGRCHIDGIPATSGDRPFVVHTIVDALRRVHV